MKKDFFNKFATAALPKELCAKLVGGLPCQVIDCGGPCTRTEGSGGTKECCDNRPNACWPRGLAVATGEGTTISQMGIDA
jgi:hypothetical protein